jgi:hypothetical protein
MHIARIEGEYGCSDGPDADHIYVFSIAPLRRRTKPRRGGFSSKVCFIAREPRVSGNDA